MTNEERIAALEQEVARLRFVLSETIPIIQAKSHAATLYLAQVAAFLPMPDELLGHLPEDVEVSGLYSEMSEEMRQQIDAEMKNIFSLLLALRRGILEAELRRLPE